jgi:predicted TIM-barrel fold metal-dependent hydrolase
MYKRIALTLSPVLMLLLTACTSTADRFADSHIHYNWDQQRLTSMQQAIEEMQQHQVKLTIVSSIPSELALELRQQGGDWIIPFFSPYIHKLGKRDWYLDAQVVKLAEQGLKDGLYYGIGEVHFMNGFKPKTDNEIFQQLIALAEKYRVPMLIHIDSGNEITFQRLCTAHPNVSMIFAHAGGNLRPAHIRKILLRCDNTWIDFAARDPWRYGGLTDDNYRLLDEWKQLVLDYPDRFITGTDPVWKVTRWSTWDTDDEGWTYYDRLYDYHWSWLNDLPADVRQKIAWENTQRLLQ